MTVTFIIAHPSDPVVIQRFGTGFQDLDSEKGLCARFFYFFPSSRSRNSMIDWRIR